MRSPLADCLAIVWWQGGDEASAAALCAEADVVLAYGGDAAIAQVQRQVPAGTRFLGYGHKLGFGLVSRTVLDVQRAPALARRAAHDIVRYEQQGCCSPHQFYVERGGKVDRARAHYLAAELANLQHRFPRRALALEEAAAVAGWRRSAELQALAQEGHELLGAADAAWTVAYTEHARPLAPTGGGRGIRVQRGRWTTWCRWWRRTPASCRPRPSRRSRGTVPPGRRPGPRAASRFWRWAR